MATAANRTKPLDAAALLKADHKAVSELFAAYERARARSVRKKLVAKICTELSVQAQREEEISCTAVKAALKDKTLIREAIVEQATMKAPISQVEGKGPDGEMFDAKVEVLSEYVKHRVKKEHTEMFPMSKKTRLDMLALGAQLAAREKELLAQRG